ncbi:signal recognition particle-docking protein FtsY [Candidatus Woesearchaeota archaeon]|nr:signal recognition particle-docking protein FtsY [Candidatus Woesearchaeota archaeon]
MFGFLKDKLKGVISGLSKQAKEEKQEIPPAQKQAAVKPASKRKAKPPLEAKPAETAAEQAEEPVADAAKDFQVQEQRPAEARPKGLFSAIRERITTTRISAEKFDEIMWDMEIGLIESNVAVEVVEKIKSDLKNAVVEKPLPRLKVEEEIRKALRKSVESLFEGRLDLFDLISSKKPFVILFLGINGSGKTTTIAKLARMLMDRRLSVAMAASDTFRAASIEQLQQHADRLKVKLIKHDYGADPAAVAFDAVRYAEAKHIDVVLVDTAGRLHSNANLMDEMKKIIRVANPGLKIFVGESITGNDCVEQARTFNEQVGLDAIILSKADVDDKGGAAVSVSYITKKPIIFIGTGQEYSDLKEFEPKIIVESLGL